MAIVTLFLLMPATGRLRWSDVLRPGADAAKAPRGPLETELLERTAAQAGPTNAVSGPSLDGAQASGSNPGSLMRPGKSAWDF